MSNISSLVEVWNVGSLPLFKISRSIVTTFSRSILFHCCIVGVAADSPEADMKNDMIEEEGRGGVLVTFL